jgi:hypothetical protein
MSCPHCDSVDTRIAEQGLLTDSYFCNRCSRSYERVSGIAKSAGLGLIIAVCTGNPFAGLAVLLKNNSSDDGSDGGGDV